jgi:hypothetical protein
LGAISRRISSRFWPSTTLINVMPVAFPPGRARLATSPAATGSNPTVAITDVLHKQQHEDIVLVLAGIQPCLHRRGPGATHRTRGREGQAASGHARDRGRARPRCAAVKVASDARSLPKGLTCTPAARQPAHMHGGCNDKRIIISVFRWSHSIAFPRTYHWFVASAVTHVRSRRGHVKARLVTIWQ